MNERQKMKKLLDDELQHITYLGRDKVIRCQSILGKCHALWNKELEIPVLPVASVAAVVFLSIGIKYSTGKPPAADTHKTIEVAGNTYWQADLERRLALYED